MKKLLISLKDKLMNKNNTLTVSMIIGTIAAILTAGFSSFARDCETLPDQVLRLHIIAASDSDSDQDFKYKLRDYILVTFSSSLIEYESLESAVQKCEKILPLIEEGAREFALSQGYDEEITAEITKMRFNTRVYDTATLPAGEYTALRIRVGEAKGKNWWCVMFPALCLPAVSESKSDTVPVINLPETVQDSPKIKFAVFEFLSVFFKPSS